MQPSDSVDSLLGMEQWNTTKIQVILTWKWLYQGQITSSITASLLTKRRSRKCYLIQSTATPESFSPLIVSRPFGHRNRQPTFTPARTIVSPHNVSINY